MTAGQEEEMLNLSELNHPSLTTQDERVMAALSHISIIIPMAVLVAPIVIWATQKDKSEYVAFQSLQALAYQIFLLLLYIISWACYGFSFLGLLVSIPLAPPEGSTEVPSPLFFVSMFLPFIIMGLIFLVFITLAAYGVIGGVMSFKGQPFRYLGIGEMVERFRENNKEDS